MRGPALVAGLRGADFEGLGPVGTDLLGRVHVLAFEDDAWRALAGGSAVEIRITANGEILGGPPPYVALIGRTQPVGSLLRVGDAAPRRRGR